MFTYLVDLTVVTVAIPYFMSAIAQLTYLVSRRRRVQGWQLARDLSVAGTSVLFSMWVTFASGYQVVYQALVVLLAGLILYAFLNARRQRLGESPNRWTMQSSSQHLSCPRRVVAKATRARQCTKSFKRGTPGRGGAVMAGHVDGCVRFAKRKRVSRGCCVTFVSHLNYGAARPSGLLLR